jgi:hypothetical protein
MKISEARGKLKVGDWVRTNGNTYSYWGFLEGEIGEIDDCGFFVWQNERDGAVGSIHPSTKGYKYSWWINWSSPGEIEILRRQNDIETTCYLTDSSSSCSWTWKLGSPYTSQYIILPKTTMQKLTSTLKRILSPELQKLYKAGLIDGNLELTNEGKNEIWALLLKHFEAELVKVAEEKISEEEKK